MRPDALFAYGTLVFPELFEAVTGARLRTRRAALDGWAARRVAGAAYPGLRRAEQERTPGRVYLGMARATWARLDAFEGELYEVVPVEVACGGERLLAGTYAVVPSRLAALSDERWDAERFRADGYDAFLAACRRFAAGASADPP